MKHDEFIKHQTALPVQFTEEAEHATRATLARAERTHRNEANWQHNVSKNLGSICEGEREKMVNTFA